LDKEVLLAQDNFRHPEEPELFEPLYNGQLIYFSKLFYQPLTDKFQSTFDAYWWESIQRGGNGIERRWGKGGNCAMGEMAFLRMR